MVNKDFLIVRKVKALLKNNHIENMRITESKILSDLRSSIKEQYPEFSDDAIGEMAKKRFKKLSKPYSGEIKKKMPFNKSRKNRKDIVKSNKQTRKTI